MDSLSLLLMTAILFINLSRTTVDTYINAYGLFSDIWAPVIEASVNVGLSIILGYSFGLHGVLSGVLISLFLVVFCWKPYYLFRKGLDEPLRIYVFMYAKHLVVTLLCGVIVFLGMRYSMEKENTTFFAGLLATLVFSFLDTLALLFVAQGMRNLMIRFVRMCHLTIIDD